MSPCRGYSLAEDSRSALCGMNYAMKAHSQPVLAAGNPSVAKYRKSVEKPSKAHTKGNHVQNRMSETLNQSSRESD
jgi:hypothetical protein